jgi:methionyl-tRNA formyltransferase
VADAEIDWKLPAHTVDRLIRACTPEPGAWTTLDGARIKLGPAAILDTATPLAPGEVLVERKAVFAGTGTLPLLLGDVQAPGKRLMPATDWARGWHHADGAVRFG